MNKNICKVCGGNIVAEVEVFENFEYYLDKNGNLAELNSWSHDSLDELIKANQTYYVTGYHCEKCEAESDNLEDLTD